VTFIDPAARWWILDIRRHPREKAAVIRGRNRPVSPGSTFA
jgi:hypothetical protein